MKRYPYIASTLALVFSLTGVGFGASHYLITNAHRQIAPHALKEIWRGSHVGPTGERGAPICGEGENCETHGPRGATGVTGPASIERGPTGDQGKEGKVGYNGLNGNPGKTGPTGEMGEEGIEGKTGPTGATGPRGPKGTTGVAGPTGVTGATASTTTVAFHGISLQARLLTEGIGKEPKECPSEYHSCPPEVESVTAVDGWGAVTVHAKVNCCGFIRGGPIRKVTEYPEFCATAPWSFCEPLMKEGVEAQSFTVVNETEIHAQLPQYSGRTVYIVLTNDHGENYWPTPADRYTFTTYQSGPEL